MNTSHSSRSLPRSHRVWRFGRCFLMTLTLVELGTFTPPATIALNEQESRDGRLKIVLELISSPDVGYEIFMATIEGLQRNFTSLADLAVIASGEGVQLLRASDNSMEKRLARLADQGIDFIVCRQGLEETGMDASDLVGFARTVQSGSNEMRKLKEQGWALVRDGDSYVGHL